MEQILQDWTMDQLHEKMDKKFKYGNTSYFNFFLTSSGIVVCRAFFKKKEDTSRTMEVLLLKDVNAFEKEEQWLSILETKHAFQRNCVYVQEHFGAFSTETGQAYLMDLKKKNLEHSIEGTANGKTPETIAYDATEEKFIITYKNRNETLTRKIAYPKK